MIRLVTVCTANLCRSPLAEHALRAAAAGRAQVQVRSTGVSVRPGSVPPADWCEVAGSLGFDLRSHRSSEADLEDADLVIGMTADHLRRLALTRPTLLGRLVTLRSAVTRLESLGLGPAESPEDLRARFVGSQRSIDILRADDHLDVADPYRRPRREQERIANEIIDLAHRFAEVFA